MSPIGTDLETVKQQIEELKVRVGLLVGKEPPVSSSYWFIRFLTSVYLACIIKTLYIDFKIVLFISVACFFYLCVLHASVPHM